MGNLFRFVEPLVLLDIARNPGSSGYDILQRISRHSLTGTTIDKAAVYRTLAVLEANGMALSGWTESARGAGRRAYRLTAEGRAHLGDWCRILASLAGGLDAFCREAHPLLDPEPA